MLKTPLSPILFFSGVSLFKSETNRLEAILG